MNWKVGLLLFAICWALQVGGTALQMRHYRKVLDGLSARWNDGFIGTGGARARFGRGAIAILVVSPAGLVRQALLMQGVTVWAKFKPVPSLVGQHIDQCRSGAAFGPRQARVALVFRQCVEQVDRIAQTMVSDKAVCESDRQHKLAA